MKVDVELYKERMPLLFPAWIVDNYEQEDVEIYRLYLLNSNISCKIFQQLPSCVGGGDGAAVPGTPAIWSK